MTVPCEIVKLRDELFCVELRQRLELENIILTTGP